MCNKCILVFYVSVIIFKKLDVNTRGSTPFLDIIAYSVISKATKHIRTYDRSTTVFCDVVGMVYGFASDVHTFTTIQVNIRNLVFAVYTSLLHRKGGIRCIQYDVYTRTRRHRF